MFARRSRPGGHSLLFQVSGSEARMAQQSLGLPACVAHTVGRTKPQWLLPNLSVDELRSHW